MAGFGKIHVLSTTEAEIRRKLLEARGEAHIAAFLVDEYVPADADVPDSDLSLRDALKNKLEIIDRIILELTGG